MAGRLLKALGTRLLLQRSKGALDVRLLWEPRDVWCGLFWTVEGGFAVVYVCLVPLLPLRFAWRTRSRCA